MTALPAAAPAPSDTASRPAPARPAGPVVVLPVLDADLTPSEVRSRHLERLSVPGTVAEGRFDRITGLASTLFGMPMSTVTLIDGDRALFPGSTGFADARPVPHESVFCDQAARDATRGVPFVVEDATADARFAALPQVLGPPYLRFYAGVPLDDDDGVTVGTFCLFDTVPRRLDRTQLAMLTQLASWARRELVDSTDMARAREVQRSLLPTRTAAPPGYELAAVCRPTKGVGGDFFDHSVVGGQLFLTLVDVMGKGVGAALVAASVRAMLRASLSYQLALSRLTGAPSVSPLSEITGATDRLLQDDLGQTGTLVTGFGAIVDPRDGTVGWVDAGHGLAVIVRADGSSERLVSSDMPIGLGLGETWTQYRSTLRPGDTLFVASDGLFDLLGGTAQALERIRDLVLDEPGPARLVERVAELTTLGTALDDVTAVAVRRDAQPDPFEDRAPA